MQIGFLKELRSLYDNSTWVVTKKKIYILFNNLYRYGH